MKRRVVLKIFGRVQGVLYRSNTKEKALGLNLTGFVRNEEDGTVRIIAEGEENNLKKLIEWCYEGSSSAEVLKVEEKWENYQRGFKSFEIRYQILGIR